MNKSPIFSPPSPSPPDNTMIVTPTLPERNPMILITVGRFLRMIVAIRAVNNGPVPRISPPFVDDVPVNPTDKK